MFNKDLPYGEIYGLSEAKYLQNGKHYDGQGNRVYVDGEEEDKEVIAGSDIVAGSDESETEGTMEAAEVMVKPLVESLTEEVTIASDDVGSLDDVFLDPEPESVAEKTGVSDAMREVLGMDDNGLIDGFPLEDTHANKLRALMEKASLDFPGKTEAILIIRASASGSDNG